jgi:hypothetical protein
VFAATITTPYRNTIPANREAFMPGDLFMERKLRSLIRWNALAMVVRANTRPGELGGHISSFASSATLYDVGFNYFFRGRPTSIPGDLIYYQGHASPGIYARSFLEGRLSEDQLDNFRREVGGQGLSFLSASLADAGLLAVPHRLDGPRTDAGDLSGPRHEVPRQPRAGADARTARSGPSSVTASATSRKRSARCRWPGARSSTT